MGRFRCGSARVHRPGEGSAGYTRAVALILTEREVSAVLSMKDAVALLEESFRLHAEGATQLAPRLVMPLSGVAGNFRIMAAVIPAMGGFGLKTLTGTPGKRAPEETYFALLYFDTETGALRAVMPGTHITGTRTGAASGVATRHLAREDASSLALIGAGFQGRNQVAAVREVREIRSVRVHDAVPEAARAFAAGLAAEGIAAEAVGSAEEAVRGADIVCAATTTREPVIRAAWLEPGMHVNSVGANAPVKREVEAAVFARSRVVLDFREQVLGEAGDLMAAVRDGDFEEAAIHAELGDIVAGRRPGRESDRDITLFKSVGVAIEDVACAAFVYDEARRRGLGTPMRLQDAR